tara:strand:+ start:3659 stop:4096 length:438 start_codon:yes stop_codon:yes gene_type:complete
MRLIFFILIIVCLGSLESLGQKKDVYIFIDRSQGEKTFTENYVEKKSTVKGIIFEKGIGDLGYLGIDYFTYKPKKHIKKNLTLEDFRMIDFKTIEQIEKDSVYRKHYKNELNFHVTCFNVHVVEVNINSCYIIYEVNWFRSFNIE